MKPLKQEKLYSLLGSLAHEEEYVFLDSVRVDNENSQSLLFCNPIERIDFHADDDPELFISQLESHLQQGSYLAGWIGYEFGYLLEEQLAPLLPESVRGKPLASFGVFKEAMVHNHRQGDGGFPENNGIEHTDFSIQSVVPSQEKDDYVKAIHKIKEYIAAGDTYQVNYTLKLLFEITGSVEGLYAHLRANQSVAYAAMIQLGGEQILSLSPELFFRIQGDRVMVRPMKGTMGRGRNLEEDESFCIALSQDPKNRSENVMIVDLLRNDLGRLTHECGDNKVVTSSLFTVERYESVLQMTSTVYTETDSNVLSQVSLLAFLRALFPCGSVTGAPKIRTMEIIRELEEAPRGVYTGAVGYFAPNGDGVFNVPIRTIRIKGGEGEMGIGSGIVHDSIPEQEWEECLLKANFLTKSQPVFSLFETMLLDGEKGFWLKELHLSRLERSATYFSFHYDHEAILEKLDEVEQAKRNRWQRVRLSLQKDGSLSTEVVDCAEPVSRSLPPKPLPVHDGLPAIALSQEAIDSSSPFFFHKTTRRELYTQAFQRAQQMGLFDMIFVNERKEVTEGSISNIILYKDGRYITPTVSSALLAGTMRQLLLSDTEIPVREQIVRLDDILQAEALFCCNAVRGVVQVRFLEER